MRFFWPSKLNPTPNVLTRFGRVLHWLATVIGLVWFVGWASVSGQYDSQWPFYVAFGAVTGFPIFLAGRALRYIFSGE
jgi:hypothetical protein